LGLDCRIDAMSARTAAAASGACAFFLVGVVTSLAQGVPPWDSRCDARGCSHSRALSESATLRRIATVSVLTEAQATGATLAVALPLGLALEPGVQFVLGDTVWPAPFKVCFPDGCSAAITLDEVMLAQLLSAPDIAVRYFAFNDGRAIMIDAPLGGLAEAVASRRP